MNIISKAVGRMKPSATMAVSQKAAELKAQGRDLISLGAGEPDFDPPQHILKAAQNAIENGKNKYTPVDGIIELKGAIKQKFIKDNQIEYQLNEIMVTAGAKQAIFNALIATLNPTDEVIIPAPCWVSYPEIVTLAGAVPVFVTTKEEDDFKITKQQLQNAISQKTKFLILNSPGNPTGSLYNADELKDLAAVLLENEHVWIISDDIYEHIIFDGAKFNNIIQVEPRLKDRVLTINGVSKAYAMTGWRIGYCAGNANVIAAMKKLQSQSTSNPASISQYAALAALEGDQEFLNEKRADFQKKRNIVVEKINNIPLLSCRKPQGAFYAYVECSKVIGKKINGQKIIHDDQELAMQLLQNEAVAIIFGKAFKLSPFFRLSYAQSEESIIKACDRIANFCSKLQ